ncbi:unnamed protein product [Trichobilharzia szidati]|nr:unnamed protein product [Trichobilharzia szidati]
MCTSVCDFSNLCYRLLSKKKDIARLRLLTEALLVLDLSPKSQRCSLYTDKFRDIRLVLLDVLVEWICYFSCIFRTPDKQKFQSPNVEHVINNTIKESFGFLEVLMDSLFKSESAEAPKSMNNFVKHLRFIMSSTSKRVYSWVDYCNKLRFYCDSMLKCFPLFDMTLLTSEEESRNIEDFHELHPSLIRNEKLMFSELKKLIMHEMSRPDGDENATVPPYLIDSDSFNAVYKSACDKANITQIIQNIETDYQNKEVNKEIVQYQSEDVEKISVNLTNIQKHLLKLSSLFTTWYTLKALSNDELSDCENIVSTSTQENTVQQQPQSASDIFELTSSTSGDEMAVRPKETRSRKCKRLVEKKCFNEFCGTPKTPGPSTPAPEEKNRKYIIHIENEGTTSLRLPWKVEESIALWHGVMHNPGAKNWSQIWRQSFRHSKRSQVNLKDRWRVISTNETIKNTIRRAYSQWKAQFTNNNGSPKKPIHLPVPIIVRDN